MNGKTVAWALLVIWLALFAASFLNFILVEPTGDGFVRGLNRMAGFVGLQAGAGALALVIWWFGQHFQRGSPGRWLCRVPAVIAFALALGVVGLIISTRFEVLPLSNAVAPVVQSAPRTVPVS